MSQIKLVAIDIDGTLLNSAGKITSRTKSTVQAVADLGIQIVISTGRRFSTAKEKVEPLEIQNLSLSCHNGIIFKQFNGQVLYHRLLDPQLARSIVAFAKSIGCYPIVFESLEDYTRIFVEPFTTEISSQPDPQTIAVCFLQFLGPNAALTVMAWVPALFEREDDEASEEAVSPSNSADPTMVCEMTQ